MKKAVMISERIQPTGCGYKAKHIHYKLNTPLQGHKYVIVSAAFTPDHGDETYIFGANAKGEIIDWSGLKGSFVGGLDHVKALGSAGYVMATASDVTIKHKKTTKPSKKTKKVGKK